MDSHNRIASDDEAVVEALIDELEKRGVFDAVEDVARMKAAPHPVEPLVKAIAHLIERQTAQLRAKADIHMPNTVVFPESVQTNFNIKAPTVELHTKELAKAIVEAFALQKAPVVEKVEATIHAPIDILPLVAAFENLFAKLGSLIDKLESRLDDRKKASWKIDTDSDGRPTGMRRG